MSVISSYRLMAEVPAPSSPLLIVLSGPSGVGKSSVTRAMQERNPDIHFAVTATTRPPRPGEVPGKSYRFLSVAEYDALLDRGELLAPALVHGHWYGAPIDELRRAFERGKDVLLTVDVQGAIQLRRRIPQAVYVFLAPPSMDDLVARLQARHTESEEELERRINDAQLEMAQMLTYDYAIVNRNAGVRAAAEDLACIVRAEKFLIHRQPISLWLR